MPTRVGKLPDYPFTSRWFSDSAGTRHYLDEGPRDAPPVLMLHGNPTWSYFWRHLVIGLRERYRCVVPDMAGMGLSSRTAEPFTVGGFQARADRIEALVTHLTVKHQAPERGWTVVVHDWSGPVGLRWASWHAERIARIIVCNTVAFPWPEGHRLYWGLKFIHASALAAWISYRHNLFALGITHQGVTSRMPRQVRAAYLAPYRRRSDRRAIEKFVRAIPRKAGDMGWETLHELGRDLTALRNKPTLLCWGMQDPVFNDQVLDGWMRRLPHAQVRLFPHAGHLLLDDVPHQVTNDVLAFLAVTAASAAGAGAS
ncbi:hypothetical protein B7P34_08405 [Streptosporangium nondiastaticum]|uniref:AB hydrolase-1 domain-containing protein n=1 Tax=Streptosporangium nondiastaticum TaxID=35764 RepID=A0A9X7JSL4_9ACTN|nr:hypothetical protein B7P34_08405 [Streptosporangium nondiastaticum]